MPVTIKHILLDCIDFIETRKRYFNVNSFNELFEKVPRTAFYLTYMRLPVLPFVKHLISFNVKLML